MQHQRDIVNDDISWFSVLFPSLGAFVALLVAALTQNETIQIVASVAFAYITLLIVSYFYFLDKRRYNARIKYRSLERQWMDVDPPLPAPWSSNALVSQSPPGIWPVFIVLVIGWVIVDVGVSLYAAKQLAETVIEPIGGALPTWLAVTALSLPGVGCLILLGSMLYRSRK